MAKRRAIARVTTKRYVYRHGEVLDLRAAAKVARLRTAPGPAARAIAAFAQILPGREAPIVFCLYATAAGLGWYAPGLAGYIAPGPNTGGSHA